MGFLDWLKPKPLPPVKQPAEPVFRGRMSYRAICSAAERGSGELMLYLLAWHVGKGGGMVSLDEPTCSMAGITTACRRRYIPTLLQEPALLVLDEGGGKVPRVRAVDPWAGEIPFFLGGMTFGCLVNAYLCRRRGYSLAVFLAAHHEFTLRDRCGPVKLGKSVRSALGIKKSAFNRAIGALESHGLLRVEQRPGASPTVIPLDPPAVCKSDEPSVKKQGTSEDAAPLPGTAAPPPPVRMPKAEYSDEIAKNEFLKALRNFEAGS